MNKIKRGFAAMDPAKQREIARMGGRAAHIAGTAHEFTSEEARAAGRKGGTASRGGKGKLPKKVPVIDLTPKNSDNESEFG